MAGLAVQNQARNNKREKKLRYSKKHQAKIECSVESNSTPNLSMQQISQASIRMHIHQKQLLGPMKVHELK